MIKPEHAKALLALIEAEQDSFATVCKDSGAEDAEAFATEIVDTLSELGAEEVADDDSEDEEEAE